VSTETDNALELEQVSKSYVGVQALTGASLACRRGEVHALVGENGAGKSTLIKIASGAVAPDEGTVRIAGRQLTRPSPLLARRLGLLTAYQDTSLVPGLTVAENVVLSCHGVAQMGFRTRPGRAAEMLAGYDLPFAPSAVVADLSPGARQLLEVVRALLHRPRVLLLDEPTAALDAESIQRLEALVDGALQDGTAVLYISHRLDEVQRIAARLTVIRDGRIQGTYTREEWSDVGNASVDDIVTLMVGERTDLAFPPKPGVAPDATVALDARGFRGDGFGPVALHAHAGEIVGIAGAEGNGQRELVRSLVGLRHGKGELQLAGEAVAIRTPAAAIRHGITFLSGDRAAESTFAELSVMENGTTAMRDQLGPAGLVLRSRQRAGFARAAQALGIVHASPDQPIRELSGGNQQKTVLARALLRPGPVLVVDEPTQGVDARARLDIYRTLRTQADDGAAVVVSSSDSAELEGLCDRVYVLSRGRVVRELAGEDVQEATIVDAFVNARGDSEETTTADGRAEPARGALRGRLLGSSWLPLGVLLALIVGLGAYTQARSSLFLSDANLTSLFVLMLPLAAVALGEQFTLLTAGFDISIGSTMSLAVVLASFWVTSPTLGGSILGILACLGVGVAIGLFNGFVIRVVGVVAIVATIATLGILQGLAIVLRPQPGGTIGFGLTDALSAQIGFMPVALIVVVALAVLAELWLRTTSSGLRWRATGLAEEPSRRMGLSVDRIKILSYVLCAVIAVVAGLLLSVQLGVGSNSVGSDFGLVAFTACFLGGAALTGGRGSFVGTLVGALFVGMLTNVTPLLGWPEATSRTAAGVLTIVAIVAYAATSSGRVRLGGVWAGRAEAPLDPTTATTPEAEMLASHDAGTR
jgi:ribose transport system ATP-binding protein